MTNGNEKQINRFHLAKILSSVFLMLFIVLFSNAYAITGYINGCNRKANLDENGNRLIPPLSSIVVVNVKTSEFASNVSIAVWSINNGQDDLVWYYDNNGGTDHYIQFDLANHGSPGETFGIHAYANSNATWLDGTNSFYWDVTPPTRDSIASETRYTSNPSQSFTVNGIKDESNYIDKIYFPTWKGNNNEGGNATWYLGTKSSSNNVYTGTFSINLTNVGDGKDGIYSIHCYPEDGAENRRLVGSFTIYYDKTNPTVTASNISYGSNVTATLKDSLSGIAGYAITTTNSQPSTWTAGNNSTEMSANFGKKDVGTYYIWTKDRAGNVGSKSITVSKINGSGSVTMANWTYGGTASNPVPTSSTNGTSSVTYKYKGRGSTTYTESTTKPSNAGTYTVTATFATTTNYNAVTATANFTINKKSITVTGDNKSKTYGTANPTFTATVGSTGISGQTGKITGTPSCSATATSDVGTYNITQGTVALTDNGDFKAANYSISWTNGTLTISKANGYVNLSATSGTTRYGTASKTFTVSSHHGGTLSVSDNHGTATCSISGTTVTISSLSGISCGANESSCATIKITVTSAATTNYKQASATYTLKIIDDVAPTGTISVKNTSTMKNGKKAVKTRDITLAITYSDAGSSVDKMAVFEQTNNVNSLLENVSTSKAFTLSTGDGEKTVYLVLRDTWGNMTAIPTN